MDPNKPIKMKLTPDMVDKIKSGELDEVTFENYKDFENTFSGVIKSQTEQSYRQGTKKATEHFKSEFSEFLQGKEDTASMRPSDIAALVKETMGNQFDEVEKMKKKDIDKNSVDVEARLEARFDSKKEELLKELDEKRTHQEIRAHKDVIKAKAISLGLSEKYHSKIIKLIEDDFEIGTHENQPTIKLKSEDESWFWNNKKGTSSDLVEHMVEEYSDIFNIDKRGSGFTSTKNPYSIKLSNEDSIKNLDGSKLIREGLEDGNWIDEKPSIFQ